MDREQRASKADFLISDIFGVVKRRRVLTLTVFVASVTFLSLYVLLKKPSFESQASIYIGQMNGVPVDPSTLIVERLKTHYGIEYAASSGDRSWIVKVSIDRADGRMIWIVGRSQTPEGARKITQAAVDEVVLAHNKKLAEYFSRVSEELSTLRGALATGRSSLEMLHKMDVSREKRFDVLGAMYSVTDLAAVQRRIAELQDFAAKSSATEVVRAPATPLNPTGIRPTLLLAIGFIAAAVASVLVAFVFETVFLNFANRVN